MRRSAATLDDYLDRVTRGLPGPRSEVRAVRDELADGLHEAANRRIARGVQPAAAARYAVREFGDPSAIGSALAADLAAARARRIGFAVLASGPIVGALWSWMLVTSAAARSARTPLELLTRTGGPVLATTLVVAIVVVVVTAGTTIVGTGAPGPWRGVSANVALRAARAAVAITVVVDLAVLATLAAPAVSSPGATPVLVLVLAGVASIVRVVACLTAEHRCRRTLVSMVTRGLA